MEGSLVGVVNFRPSFYQISPVAQYVNCILFTLGCAQSHSFRPILNGANLGFDHLYSSFRLELYISNKYKHTHNTFLFSKFKNKYKWIWWGSIWSRIQYEIWHPLRNVATSKFLSSSYILSQPFRICTQTMQKSSNDLKNMKHYWGQLSELTLEMKDKL